jgi:hypothetical protein
VIVVSGLPRSGTSMMMQMLAAGGVPVLADDARPADADNPRGYFELARMKRLAHESAWLAAAGGHAVKVVAALLPSLPAGPRWDVLFMVRPLPAVLASQALMLRRRDERHDVADADMAAQFARHLARVRAALADRADVRLLDVDYDAVLSAPHEWAVTVAAWLGGAPDTEAMAAAVEPLLRHHGG